MVCHDMSQLPLQALSPFPNPFLSDLHSSKDGGIDGIGGHAPLAAGAARRAGVAGGHGASSRREGAGEQRRAGELGDGSAHHCGGWLW